MWKDDRVGACKGQVSGLPVLLHTHVVAPPPCTSNLLTPPPTAAAAPMCSHMVSPTPPTVCAAHAAATAVTILVAGCGRRGVTGPVSVPTVALGVRNDAHMVLSDSICHHPSTWLMLTLLLVSLASVHTMLLLLLLLLALASLQVQLKPHVVWGVNNTSINKQGSGTTLYTAATSAKTSSFKLSFRTECATRTAFRTPPYSFETVKQIRANANH